MARKKKGQKVSPSLEPHYFSLQERCLYALVMAQEQLEKVLRIKTLEDLLELRPVLSRFSQANGQLVARSLEEFGAEKEAGAALRQEAAPIGQHEFGVSALSGHSESSDDI